MVDHGGISDHTPCGEVHVVKLHKLQYVHPAIPTVNVYKNETKSVHFKRMRRETQVLWDILPFLCLLTKVIQPSPHLLSCKILTKMFELDTLLKHKWNHRAIRPHHFSHILCNGHRDVRVKHKKTPQFLRLTTNATQRTFLTLTGMYKLLHVFHGLPL